MLLKKSSENGFSANQFSNRIFPSTHSYFIRKSSFHRILEGVCTLYSIGESVQCIHSLLYVLLDNVVANNTSRRTASCRLIA